MANPFLFDTDYGGGMAAETATAPAAPPPAANPFLSDFGGDMSGVTSSVPDFGMAAAVTEVNPFLSYQPAAEPAYTMSQEPVGMGGGGNAGATNPFASFVDASVPMDMAPAPAVAPQSTGAAMFGGAIDHGAALFGGMEATPAVAVDTLLDMAEEPSRPPPASVPSSTKDLLETVTGALEATSDSLLDRLRATQPSPIMAAIQPSPSPRSPSPDLLLGEDPPPPPPPSANPLAPSPGLNQMNNIMDLFDAPKSSGPKSSLEILGLYNSMSNAATTAPAKPEPLLDLLDSIPPAVTNSAEPMQVAEEPPQQSMPSGMDLGPAPSAAIVEITPAAPPLVPSQPVIQAAPPAPVVEPPSPVFEPPAPVFEPPSPVFEPPAPVVEPPAPVVEPPKPQPMRPPPPAPKAAPPERPKPPPPVQPISSLASLPPQPEVTVVEQPPTPAPVIQPEQRSPLPSRPPPPVPPAPRVTPQPQHIPAESPQQIKSPSPPISKTSTPSPSRQAPPPIPSQPSPFASSWAPPPPPVSSVLEQSAPASSITTDSTSSVMFGLSNSPFAPPSTAAEFSTTGGRDAFYSSPAPAPVKPQPPAFAAAKAGIGDSFDAFEAKFSQAASAPTANAFGDPFGGGGGSGGVGGGQMADLDAWGDSNGGFGASDTNSGFGSDGFDSFLSLTEPPPVPQSTPAKRSTAGDDDDFDEEEKDMSIVIKPKSDKDFSLTLAPALAPPPKSPAMSTGSAFSDENTAYVPFLSSARDAKSVARDQSGAPTTTTVHRSDSQDSPQTPLYEEDQSQPLEDFPRITYEGEGWDMFMRLPNKKKITGQRFWKKVFVKVGFHNEIPAVQIYTNKGDKDPFQEIPLQPCYSVSEISAQQFDQFGKVFTLKLQYIFYKERPGVRPGQISKAGRLSDKLTQFAAYAIQGDYAGVKEFGSDLKKLGAPIEHSPQISQLCKLGTATYEDIRQFSIWIEENLFRMSVHRDRAINYKTEEIQVTLVDEYYVEQDIYGVVTRQIARVRLFFLSFLNGVAEVEMGVNDLRRQGKEIVGRHDIIPVPTEEWIRMEAIEFSNCVQLDEFESTQTIKFKPPDACYIELMRFRVRPPKHRELPLQVKTVFTTLGQRIEIRSDILVPGFTSRKLGQIPCEDVMVRFPIPEEWIYMFRVEKHFRYGSVKSAHRRSGKVKGIERFLGAVEAVEQSLMETTSGQAKYEHHHKAIVWRIPRLPKEGQGAYTQHSFFCHITLQAHERIPDNLAKHCFVEFTMPHTTVSHTVCRSISAPTCDEPPEKCCRYLSRHEYLVEIEHTQGVTPGTYTVAAAVKKEEPPPPPEEEKPMPGKAESDSDFSDD